MTYSDSKECKFDLFEKVILKRDSSSGCLKKNTRCLIEEIIETQQGCIYVVCCLKDFSVDDYFMPQYEVFEEEIDRLDNFSETDTIPL